MSKFIHLVRSSGSWSRMLIPLDNVAHITETTNMKYGNCTEIFLKDCRTVTIPDQDMTYSQVLSSVNTIEGIAGKFAPQEMFPTEP